MTTWLERRLARIICGPPRPYESPLWGPLGTKYERKWEVLGHDIEMSWKTDNMLGRFGGGWNWELGVNWGTNTVLIHLLTFTVRIDKKKVAGTPGIEPG